VQIVSIRAQTENLTADEEALATMGEIGARTSLRYAVQVRSEPSSHRPWADSENLRITLADRQTRDGPTHLIPLFLVGPHADLHPCLACSCLSSSSLC
jgi:TIP49 AAA-lid domain